MSKRLYAIILMLLLPLWVFTGCGGASDTSFTTTDGSVDSAPVVSPPVTPASVSLEMIDDENFNSLSEDDKVYVAKKLYSTIYKGLDYSTLLSEVNGTGFISQFQSKLTANVTQPDLGTCESYIPYDESMKTHRSFADVTDAYAGNIKQEILSRLYCTNLGRKYLNEWIAYVLTQTILFSPAREVDSVTWFPEFIRNVYYRLVEGLDAGKSIKEIAYNHMISTENWGRFRSPEDNGREMLEIWLKNYEDEPVSIAAKALQNWSFDNYYSPELGEDAYTFNHDAPGDTIDEPVELFGKTLSNGYDFFKMVVEHPDFMPTVVSRVVDYFFPTLPEAERASIVEKIMEEEPTTFQELFAQILFSKKYLFESDKVKSLEEVFYHLVESLPYHVIKNSWGSGWASNIKGLSAAMDKANQRSMWNKLGRDNDLPTDTLSINYYHQYVRDGILLAQCDNPESEFQEGIVLRWFDERLDTNGSVENYLDGIFLEVLGRHMKDSERETLAGIVRAQGWDERFSDFASNRFKVMKLSLDYISRLSEVYRYKRIEGGAK